VGFEAFKKERVFVKAKRFIRQKMEEDGVDEVPEEIEVVKTEHLQATPEETMT